MSHQNIIDRFRKTVERDRLANTYLFVGLPGIGKRRFAMQLAEVLLCENRPDGFDSCGTCPACQQVRSLSHPDLILITKPPDKAFIPVEVFIGDKEHRRREGLCHDIGLKPFRGGCKVAIIDDADFLNAEGANSLLKTLEEPPPHSLLILIGASEQRQLPTIISRSQVIRFDPLSTDQVKTILEQLSDFESEIPTDELAAASSGSVERALQLADPEVFRFRNDLFEQLATCDPGRDDFSKTMIGFVDAAGKDSAKKRQRLTLLGDLAIEFFRQWYLQSTGLENDSTDVQLCAHVAGPASRWQASDPDRGAEIAASAIDRCIEFQRQVAANVNQANAVEGWLIDLGKICRGKELKAV